MKKVLLTLTAVLALTVATRFMTVQAEEMAAEETDAADAIVNEAINELNNINEVINEVVEDGAEAGDSASGGVTQ